MLILAISLRAGVVKIWSAIVAALVRARDLVGDKLRYRSPHRPLEGINGADHQHRLGAVPAGIAEHLAAIIHWRRLESPRRVGAQFSRNAKVTKNRARFLISCNDQRICAEPSAHFADRRIHMASFASVANRELVFRGGDA